MMEDRRSRLLPLWLDVGIGVLLLVPAVVGAIALGARNQDPLAAFTWLALLILGIAATAAWIAAAILLRRFTGRTAGDRIAPVLLAGARGDRGPRPGTSSEPLDEATTFAFPAAPPAAPLRALVSADGRRYVLDGILVLGRAPIAGADEQPVAVGDSGASVSKTHARIGGSTGGAWVEDLGSTNGTAVRDSEGGVMPVPPGQHVVLEPGDTLYLGDVPFRVTIHDRPGQPAVPPAERPPAPQ